MGFDMVADDGAWSAFNDLLVKDKVRVAKIFPGYTLYADRRACFDFSPDWDKLHDVTTWSQSNNHVFALLNMLNLGRFRLLSVGCGIGMDCNILHEMGLDVDYYGCDPDARAIKHAQKAYGKLGKFFCASVEELDFPEHWFDIVLFPSSLNYIESVETAIVAAVRLAAKFVFATATLVAADGTTRYFRRSTKELFGVDAVIPETIFDESELTEMFVLNGLFPRRPVVGSKRHLALADGDFCTAFQKLLIYERPL